MLKCFSDLSEEQLNLQITNTPQTSVPELSGTDGCAGSGRHLSDCTGQPLFKAACRTSTSGFSKT